MKPLILASESPRRRELLTKAGYNFDVFSVKVSECPNKNLNAHEQILDIARRKSRAALKELHSQGKQNFLLITADTEVIFKNQPLGKPQDEQDAYRILKLLSGTDHQVITAICVADGDSPKEMSQYKTTSIHFRPLSEEEIWDYVRTGEPMDKAGAYGIQGLGGKLIERYDGDFDNVVGLPISLLQEMLESF